MEESAIKKEKMTSQSDAGEKKITSAMHCDRVRKLMDALIEQRERDTKAFMEIRSMVRSQLVSREENISRQQLQLADLQEELRHKMEMDLVTLDEERKRCTDQMEKQGTKVEPGIKVERGSKVEPGIKVEQDVPSLDEKPHTDKQNQLLVCQQTLATMETELVLYKQELAKLYIFSDLP